MDRFLLNNIKKLEQEKNISEIYLFGSVARGEQDKNSDIDILIVVDDCTEDEYIKYKDEFANCLGVPASWLSVYRISKIQKMYNIGSYFLWHIKTEGKKIYSRNNELSTLLLTLPQYKHVDCDLDEYEQILNDIIQELSDDDICIEYELSLLASLVRNTCIALSYLNGRLDFGRNSPVIYCISKYQINVTLDEYERLYQYRLFSSGKISAVPNGEVAQLEKWIDVESKLLKIAKKGVRDCEQIESRVE